MKIQDEIRRRLDTIETLSKKMTLRAPATEAQIVACEEKIGIKFPPSYRAFLLLHDGATNVFEFDRLFGTKDFGSKWYEKQKEYWLDVDWPDAIFETSLPFLMAEAGSGVENFFAFARSKPGKNGELAVIDWDGGDERERLDGFLALLDDQIALAEESDDDDDEDENGEEKDE